MPLSFLWAVATWLRRRLPRKPQALDVKTVCVGNIHSGGSGKSPLVLEIVSHFERLKPAILTRGYGRSGRGVALVDSEKGWEEYGDEPWMYRQRTSGPVIVSRKRIEARSAILEQKSKLVVMDDGFQHLAVKRDVDLVAINVDRDPDESHCLPMGDLREPLSAVKRAGAVVFTGNRNSQYLERWKSLVTSLSPQPYFFAERRSEGFHGEAKKDLGPTVSVFAVCGIASPERFLSDLQSQVRLVGSLMLPDHCAYSDKDVSRIRDNFEKSGAQVLVTTEKDYYKLTGKLNGISLVYLRVGYHLEPSFWKFLEERVGLNVNL